jgi:hypothetical protein
MSEPTAYPLSWPAATPRWKGDRLVAKFNRKVQVSGSTPGTTWQRTAQLTIAQGIDRVQAEIARFGGAGVLISTNLKLRRDGLPFSDQREPRDPGVAVYFTLRKRPYCLPCDRWMRVADNLAAVAAHLAALRGIERWGVGTVEQAFTGYLALPDPNHVDWRAVFPKAATLADVELLYREQARSTHPDADGGHDAMVRLNRARDAARAELGEGQQQRA